MMQRRSVNWRGSSSPPPTGPGLKIVQLRACLIKVAVILVELVVEARARTRTKVVTSVAPIFVMVGRPILYLIVIVHVVVIVVAAGLELIAELMLIGVPTRAFGPRCCRSRRQRSPISAAMWRLLRRSRRAAQVYAKREVHYQI